MSQFEYSVIPAPSRGEKAKDARTPGDRYAVALAAQLNRMAKDGWEYLRADVLPSEERSGLTGRSTVYHNLLIFRRSLAGAPAAVTAPAEQPQDRPALPRQAAPDEAAAPAAAVSLTAAPAAAAVPGADPQPVPAGPPPESGAPAQADQAARA